MSAVMYALWTFAAGALIPLMAILNAGLARVPGVPTLVHVAPCKYAGGLIVVFYILSITFIAPRLGVGNAILFAVTAQLFTSALIDHFALAGASLRPLTAMRVIGLLIVIAGVIMTQMGDRVSAAPH